MGSVLYIFTICIVMTKSKGDSSEDPHQFVYNHAYAPHTVDFHDIYLPGNTVPEETSGTTDEDFRLNTISTQFVEFHPQVLKIHPITPKPRVHLNSSSVKNDTDHSPLNSSSITTTTTAMTTTREPYDIPIKVVPVKHYQRGVLDLLLPASRVRTFKSVFDTFRRMLSYTFKRR